ncbi:MAG: hypothetical protein R3C28_24995 [Pirellulaceae bacterium]
MWNGMLWGVDFLDGKTWAFDGNTFLDGGRMPGPNRPLVSAYTDYGVFLMGPSGSGANTKSEIVYSPDGFQDFTTVLSIVSENKGVPYSAGLRRTLADLGEGRMLYFEYSDNARIFYSDNRGQDWRQILQPFQGSIRHFHGGFYDQEYGKLYLMSGDADRQASIMVCDDLFGENGLIQNPDLWAQRWGLNDLYRTTLEPQYFLGVDGVIRSQRTRSVDMEIDGDYVYWGEDAGFDERQSIYRAHRVTGEVSRVGLPGMVGGPWRILHTADDDLLVFNASIHFNGQLERGMDEFVHIYQINDDRNDYSELARFLTRSTTGTGANAYGFVDAFDRIWINGYNVTNRNLDLVGKFVEITLGDVNGDDQVTIEDIDSLTSHILANGSLPVFDMDLSGYVDQTDRQFWVQQIVGTTFGDANLDGQFDSSDLVRVFEYGQYEDALLRNSGWAAGDWNGDGEFTSTDLTYAFQSGQYEAAGKLLAVPEPTASLFVLLLAALATGRRLNCKCSISSCHRESTKFGRSG